MSANKDSGKDKDKDKGKDPSDSPTISTTTDAIRLAMDQLPAPSGSGSKPGKPPTDAAKQRIADRIVNMKKAHADAQAAAKSDAKALDALNKTGAALKDVSRQVTVAVAAFRAGDDVTGTGAVMDMCATVMGVIGSVESAAGPAGALFGALFSLLSIILRAFAPQQKSLTEQIEGMLREVLGEGYEHKVKAAINDYETAYAVIEDKVKQGSHMTEAQMHDYCPVTNTPDALYLYAANDWLENKDNQRQANRSWQAVLEANLQAISLQFRNYTTALSILEPPDVRHNLYKGYLKIIEAHLASLNNLEAVIRDKAVLWFLSNASEHLQVRRVEQPFAEVKNLGGESRTFSAARAAGSDVVLVFALEGDGNTSDMSQPFQRYKRAYVKSAGPEFGDSDWTELVDLPNLLDIHALPGAQKGEVLLYMSCGIYSGVSRYKLDAAGKAQRVEPLATNEKFNWGLNIRGIPGDGGAAYYLLKWSEQLNVFVQTTYDNIFGVPWDGCHGIVTCKDFLWAFMGREIAYLTHEEAKTAKGSANWHKLPQVPVETPAVNVSGGIISSVQHLGTYPGPVIKSLSASDDQTLTASFLGHVWATTWEKKDDGSVGIDGWKPVAPNPPLGYPPTPRVQRMPLRVWRAYEDLRQSLNKTLATAPD